MSMASCSNYSLLLFSSPPSSSLPISSKFPTLSSMIHSRRQHPVVLKVKSIGGGVLGFSDLKQQKGFGCSIHLLQRNSWCGSIRRKCNKGLGSEGEGDFGLETEILKFMDCSENPNKFPTKKDLINAGRGDLVEAIEKNGHWLSKGWDLDKEEEVEEIVQENEVMGLNSSGVEEEEDLGSEFLHSDDRIFQERCFNGGKCDSLESVEEDDSGINGILKRLEKERNLSFGFGSREKEIDIADDLSCKNDYYDEELKLGSLMAAEIGLDVATDNIVVQKNVNETEEEEEEEEEEGSPYVQTGQDWFRSCVQHLELEPASTLRSLKSASEIDISSLKGSDNPSDEFFELSDSWEFKETEVMNAKNKLQSIRAKLAILEGMIRRRSNKGWGGEGEGDVGLETEILKFMDCSENPNKFPTKKDLINAGRSDLVEAIEKKGYWLSKGWDLDKEEEVEEIVQENEVMGLNSGVEKEDLGSEFLHSDDRIFQEKCFNGAKCDSLEGVDVGVIASEDSSSSSTSEASTSEASTSSSEASDTWNTIVFKILMNIWASVLESVSETEISLNIYEETFTTLYKGYIKEVERDNEEMKSIFYDSNKNQAPPIFMNSMEEACYTFVFNHTRWLVGKVERPVKLLLLIAVCIPVLLARFVVFTAGVIVNALLCNVPRDFLATFIPTAYMKWVGQYFYPKPPPKQQPRPKEEEPMIDVEFTVADKDDNIYSG